MSIAAPSSPAQAMMVEGYVRHCERSEAIQLPLRGKLDCFVAEPVIGPAKRPDPLAPRNDELQTCVRDLAACYARALPEISLPSKTEGAGKTGCALHPRSRVQVAREVRTRAYRSSGEHPAFPAQWLYGLCRALPGDEFFWLSPSSANERLISPVELVSPPPI